MARPTKKYIVAPEALASSQFLALLDYDSTEAATILVLEEGLDSTKTKD